MRTTIGIVLFGATFAGALFGASATEPALIEAAKAGKKEVVRSLIAAKANVNEGEPDGTTALIWAAYRDDIDSADALIKAGAKVNAANDLGATALWTASQNGGSEIVKRLLDAGADPNLALLSGETPLMVASRGGYADVVSQLLGKGAKVNAIGTRAQTALMWAAAEKHPEVTKVLLDHGADLNMRSSMWIDIQGIGPHGYLPYNKPIPHGGDTALMFAARNGDAESAKLLLAKGADPDDTDAWGMSALTLAAHSGFADVIDVLLAKKANPNFMLAGIAPIHNAIMRRDERIVKALLDHGADPNFQLRIWTPNRRSADDWHYDPMMVGASPLWLAARIGEPNIVKMLLDKGADPKFVHHAVYVAELGFGQGNRDESFSVLHAAVGMAKSNAWVDIPATEREPKTLETVKILLDHGVEINYKSPDGKTALDGARTQRFQSVIAYLTEKGATGSAAPAGPGGGRGGPRPPAPVKEPAAK
jgi:ankyrin repeat protein